MDWEILPLKAFGKIRFGESLEDVCQKFGDNFKVRENKLLGGSVDCFFNEPNFRIGLDENERVSEIGVHKPEFAYFQGIQLLNRDMYELERELRDAGYGFEFVDLSDGLIHIELGIGITMVEGITRTVEVFDTRMYWYENEI